MTSRFDPTDRPTSRVDPDIGPATEFAGLYAPKAPESSASRGTSGSGPERRHGRIGPRRRERLGQDLSGRDLAILRDLDRYRFLTTKQLETLHFQDHQSSATAARVCRNVLYRLSSYGVIDHLERRVGGVRAGSASYVWRVGPVGDRLLRIADLPRLRRKEPSVRLLDHTLAISDCVVRVTAAARTATFELLRLDPEPFSWRSYLAAGGVSEVLKPDLFVVTATGDFEDHWFLEIDRGTESLPTVLKKCAQYKRYRRTGKAQTDGGVFPKILWLAPHEWRATNLRDAIELDRSIDRELHAVLTTDQLVEHIAGATS